MQDTFTKAINAKRAPVTLDNEHCILTVGGDTQETVGALIVQAGVEFTLLEPL